jgi:hypothetical protein
LRKSPPTGCRTADKEPKVEFLTPLIGRPKAAATLAHDVAKHDPAGSNADTYLENHIVARPDNADGLNDL